MMVVKRERDAEQELNLPPGFRFHPTDEELVVHYLCRKATHQFIPVPIIAEVDLYKYNPWQLPEKALFGQKEWYFFTPRDRKYPNGSRPNRAAGTGYWKATGADKPVTPAGSSRPLGIKKALVFYSGKAPRGAKTNWIMHEYRLADTNRGSRKGTLRLDDWVLCRLYNKKNNWEKEIQQQQQQTEEDASFGEATESGEVRSDNHRTPESDVDNDVYAEFPYQIQGYSLDPADRPNEAAVAAATAGGQTGERAREDSDWFMDLNLDDLHNSFATVGDGTTPLDMVAGYHDYYYNGLPSPMPRTSTSTQLGVLRF